MSRLRSSVERLSLPILWALLALCFFGITFTLAVIEGLLLRNPATNVKEGFLNDFSTSLDFALFNPIILLALHKFNRALAKTFNTEVLTQLGACDGKVRDRVLTAIWKALKHPVIPAFSAVAAVGMMVPHYLALRGQPGLYIVHSWAGLTMTGGYVLILTTVVIYAVNSGVLKGFVYNWAYRQIGRHCSIRMDIFNADGAGGTKPLLRPIRYYNVFLVTCSAVIVVFVLHDIHYLKTPFTYRIGVSSVFYVVLFPLLLFLPWFTLHREMQRFRLQYLTDVTSKLNQLASRFLQSEAQLDEKEVRTYEQYRDIYDVAIRFSTWPISLVAALNWIAIYYLPSIIAAVIAVLTAK